MCAIVCLKPDGTGAETRLCLSPEQTSPFKSVGASVQSTSGSRGVCISFSNAGYTTFRGRLRVLATHSIHQFPLHFPSRASPCAIRFQTHSTIRLMFRNFSRILYLVILKTCPGYLLLFIHEPSKVIYLYIIALVLLPYFLQCRCKRT